MEPNLQSIISTWKRGERAAGRSFANGATRRARRSVRTRSPRTCSTGANKGDISHINLPHQDAARCTRGRAPESCPLDARQPHLVQRGSGRARPHDRGSSLPRSARDRDCDPRRRLHAARNHTGHALHLKHITHIDCIDQMDEIVRAGGAGLIHGGNTGSSPLLRIGSGVPAQWGRRGSRFPSQRRGEVSRQLRDARIASRSRANASRSAMSER